MSVFKRALVKLSRWLPDEPYLYLLFFLRRNQWPNLRYPKTYSEKINWLKLHGGLDKYSRLVDKFTVREYIADTIGEQYLVPLLGVWDHFDDIPFETLPERFVLKATDGSDYTFICYDKRTVDYAKLRRLADSWLRQNFYKLERELQYKGSKPRLIVEEYLEDPEGDLRDYKFTCVNGEPKIIQVDVDRFHAHKSYMLNPDWSPLGYASSATYPAVGSPDKKPANLDAMLQIARVLSRDFPFVRVDLYSVNNHIYFGELTFTPASGFAKFTPVTADLELGKLLDLEKLQPSEHPMPPYTSEVQQHA